MLSKKSSKSKISSDLSKIESPSSTEEQAEKTVRVSARSKFLAKLFWRGVKAGAENAKLLSKNTLLKARNEPGFIVSRLGVFEMNSMSTVKNQQCVGLMYSAKRNLYHIVAHASSFEIRIQTCFSVCRTTDSGTAEILFHRYCPVLNALYPFIEVKIHKKKVLKLQEIVDCMVQNPNHKASHIAAELGYCKAFHPENSEILRHINRRDPPYGYSPLVLAIQSESILTVNAIMSLKVSLWQLDFAGNTILHHAVKANTAMFVTILEALKREKVIHLLRRQNNQGYTPLHWCCLSGNSANLRSLLKLNLPMDTLVAEPRPCQNLDEHLYTESASTSSNEIVFPLDIEEPKILDSKAESKFSIELGSSVEEGIHFDQFLLKDLDDSEVIFAGCPLHWCKSSKALNFLLESGFSPESRNFRGESPIHVFIRRKRFKCGVNLLAFGVDLNARDYRGNAPIHLAVKKNDVPMVQALIGFDADINSLNSRNESARHLAATHARKLSHIIVNVLHRVGAKRCPKERLNCTNDCSYEGKGVGTSHPNWSKLDKPIEKEVKKRLSDVNPLGFDNNDQITCMVSFDGGGVRGLFSCILMLEIERRLKNPFRDYFDWLIGTSSGSLIASLLSLGMPLNKIRSLYYTFKDKIFEGKRPYESGVLENVLREYLGPQRTFSDVKDKKLMVTAVLTDRLPPKLCIFRGPIGHELKERKSNAMISKSSMSLTEKSPRKLSAHIMACYPDYNYLWLACRASGAAPTFFKPAGSFIDGGILSNNPTVDGLTEFHLLNKAAGDSEKQDKLCLVLSIGTGNSPVREGIAPDMAGLMSPRTYGEMVKSLVNMNHILKVLISGNLQTEGHVSRRAEAWCHSLGIPYFRLNPLLSQDLELNTIDDDEVVNGMWETKVYVHSMSSVIDKLVATMESFAEAKGIDKKLRKNPSYA